MKWIVRGIGAATAGVIGIPALMTLFDPVLRRKRIHSWQPLGELEVFPLGGVTPAIVRVPRNDRAEALKEKGVYVWRPNVNEFVVFSRSCTDLGCPITWDPGSEWFLCPCHGGIFAKNGDRMAGPPKVPLYRYENRIREGRLEIDLRSLPPMT